MNKTILIIALFALAMVGFASAYPTVVTGTVYDSAMNPVSGASVHVECTHDLTNYVRDTLTIADGSYYVVYDNAVVTECDFDDLFTVSAEKNGQTGMAENKTCSANECFIPVGLADVQIPEFGLIGAMLVVLGGLGIVAYRRR